MFQNFDVLQPDLISQKSGCCQFLRAAYSNPVKDQYLSITSNNTKYH